jgi:hypothetical protein
MTLHFSMICKRLKKGHRANPNRPPRRTHALGIREPLHERAFERANQNPDERMESRRLACGGEPIASGIHFTLSALLDTLDDHDVEPFLAVRGVMLICYFLSFVVKFCTTLSKITGTRIT